MPTPEELAAEAAIAASQMPEEKAATAAEKGVYTPKELEALTPTDIDIERVDPVYRPIVENTIRDYKSLQADHTRKSQELAELKKTQVQETYFEDSKKEGVFKDYLKNPLKIIGDINAEIANLEAIIPEDGAEEYRKARRQIAYWNGVKDEFSAKRSEITDRRREKEIATNTLKADLGEKAIEIIAYAETVGIDERQLGANSNLRKAVKTMYAAAFPGKGKEVKPNPHKAGKPSGEAGDGGSGDTQNEESILMNPDTPSDVRMAIWKKRRQKGE